MFWKNVQSEASENQFMDTNNFTPDDSENNEIHEMVVKTNDITEGDGKEATDGDVVRIYFENLVQGNSNVVGRVNNGHGVTLTLGSKDGTVIEGLEIGIIGMKVGGTRQIISPPKFAYGDAGILPFIPANATVISTVTLLEIV
ncbi:46 kDa FK506-binding nuclear protein-like [Contarinia nasturtii]|uniref:46 kDa FK506-binding nuclear protein-like n=1 Tax=Contarinia nasturtii TaxID=265458 RepID=UPI0012D3CB36|nr:46 kDa FK506-binding nuclear protein-like [Contarinia nasturtii]